MSYIPNKKTARLKWGNNFSTQLGVLARTLGVPTTTVQTVTTLTTNFGNGINAAESAKAQARASVQAQDAAEKALFDLIRPLVQELQRSPAMTNQMRAQLGINVPEDGRTPVNPTTPADLIASVNGINASVGLKWKRNGNPTSVVFIVEARTSSGWSQVWAGTRTRATLTGFTPGETAWFRVIATSADKRSLPSNESAIYGDGETVAGLQIAA